MRIAQVAPLFESVPPRMYGGTERIVHYLTEELIRMGHGVTLFASGDSQTSAHLIPVCDKALRLAHNSVDPIAHHITQLQMVQEHIADFDIVHYHTDYFHFPLSVHSDNVHVTTLHGRLDIADLQNLYHIFNTVPLVSISNNQRKPFPDANWVDTVYHGLPVGLYDCYPDKGKYLAFIGRISPEKGPDKAILMAKKAGIKLKIAAKISDVDERYFETEIKQLMDDPMIEFLGEIDEEHKGDFLGNALALLFPIDWPEPFGIVMTEAMACGTPVIAYNRGSVPEIIEHKKNGFIINSIDEGITAIEKIDLIDRKQCRKIFEEKYTANRMTQNYLRIYDSMIRNKNNSSRVSVSKC